MSALTVKVERELPSTFLADIMVTAFDGDYGSCWYWCEPYFIGQFGRCLEEDENGRWNRFFIKPTEEVGIGVADNAAYLDVNFEALAVGIQRVIDDENLDPTIREYVIAGVMELDAGNIDSIAADCIVQAGVFGKVVFG